MALIKLSAIEQRRVSAFITCLLIAFVVWVSTILSSKHDYKVKEILTFKNIPQKRAFHSLQPDTVTATLQCTGWEIIFQQADFANRPITVDLRSLENKDFVVLSTQLKQINERKDFDQTITAISPDTLYFDFTGRKSKKIPVKLLTDIKYQPQFGQSNNATLFPGFITVSGPAKVIDSINSWRTDTLKLDSVGQTIRTSLPLQAVNEANISIYPKSVAVHIPVDEFTEKTVQIPVKLVNNHNLYNVKIFPQKVSVTFTISMRRYPEMDEDFFEAVADLDLWRNNGYNTLPVKLTRLPAFCKIVKIEPANVDFIIRK